MYERKLDLSLSASESCFLWGPRQTGKSTLLKQRYTDSTTYDLLLSREYERLLKQPELLRQECQALEEEARSRPVIIDEIQKLPALLDEVHWLIENAGLRFIMSGSSARKLTRGRGNLLGGRAVRYELHPLVSAEIPDLDLDQALNAGMLPRHYQSSTPRRLLQSYVGDYLKEEIVAEALLRKIPAFSRFMEVAALANGELLNYTNIASECGVSAPTVKEYYQILVDTLIGFYLPAFRKRAKRRVIQASKFYFFDVGVVAYLTGRGQVSPGTELFGRAFEHFLTQEVRAHAAYSELFYPLHYWRTAGGAEVDLVLGDGEVAVEIKSARIVQDRHLRGMRSFMTEHRARRHLVVSLDERKRKTKDGIEILSWKTFLEELWSGGVLD